MEIEELMNVDKYYFEKRKILLVGGTGLIGKEVQRIFEWEGHSLNFLSTNKNFVLSNDNAFYWNVDEQYIDEMAFEGVEVIVNLAGANIAGGYWTKKRMNLIYSSRVMGTKLLADTCERINKKLIFYVGASATGYYGPNNTQTACIEDDPPGEGFLAKVCKDWEEQHWRFKDMSEVVNIGRISNVFSGKGGFMIPFFKVSGLGMRVYLTKKQHLFSWIHVEDVARFVSACLYMNYQGVYNLVSNSDPWFDLQKTIYKRLGNRIIRFYVPSWFFKITLGEMATLFVDGNFSSGMKLEKTGFMTKHMELSRVLEDVCNTYNQKKK